MLSIVVLIWYTMDRIEAYKSTSEAQISQTWVKENFFSQTEVLKADMGLAIAAIFKDSENKPLDPNLGELAFYRKSWNVLATGEVIEFFRSIKSHICTDTDFGFDGDDDPQFKSMDSALKD